MVGMYPDVFYPPTACRLFTEQLKDDIWVWLCLCRKVRTFIASLTGFSYSDALVDHKEGRLQAWIPRAQPLSCLGTLVGLDVGNSLQGIEGVQLG